MERFDNAPERKMLNPESLRPGTDIEKAQRALARKHAIEQGKVKEFDAAMRPTEGRPTSQPLSEEENRKKYLEGTVDKDVLAEASQRKMHAGGTRPLKEFVLDVLRERAGSGQKAA